MIIIGMGSNDYAKSNIPQRTEKQERIRDAQQARSINESKVET